jgi:hypothetical protein
MKSQTTFAFWILIVGAALAHAQTGIWTGVGPAPHSGAVKDAPFSADVVSINDQVNGAPGIKTEFHGKVARDSQGDSYYAMENISPVTVSPRPLRITITNFSTSTVTALDPQSRTAYVSHVAASMLGAAPTLTPGNVQASPDGRPAVAASGADPNTTAEQLGTKEINGLRVIGLRTTHTVPASTEGGKTYVSTVETWTSPDLQIVVMIQMQTSNGDRHVTRLENIIRNEPGSELFQVPPGYTVRNNVPVATNGH